MSATDAQRQREYKQRVRDSGRVPMTVVVGAETATAVHTMAQEHAVSAGRVLDALVSSSPADQIGGKRGARLRNLREVFDLAASDAGVAAGAEFVRSVRGVALAEDGAARRARKIARRVAGAKGGV